MRVVVAPVRDFPDGERRIVSVGGRSIGVFRVGESFYGIRNRCPTRVGRCAWVTCWATRSRMRRAVAWAGLLSRREVSAT